jgi:hypothetical protein
MFNYIVEPVKKVEVLLSLLHDLLKLRAGTE